MANVQHISEIKPSFAFTEYDFYKNYEEAFKKSELGRIHSMLPLHEMAANFGLIESRPQAFTSAGGQGGADVPQVIHQLVVTQAAGRAQCEHLLSDVLRHPHQSWQSTDQQKNHRRHLA